MASKQSRMCVHVWRPWKIHTNCLLQACNGHIEEHANCLLQPCSCYTDEHANCLLQLCRCYTDEHANRLLQPCKCYTDEHANRLLQPCSCYTDEHANCLLQCYSCYTEEHANCLLQPHNVTLKNINPLLFSTEGSKHHNFPLEKPYQTIKSISKVKSHTKYYSCGLVYHNGDIFMYIDNLTLWM